MIRWIVAGLVSLVITIVHLIAFASEVGQRVEPLALDLWFKVRGQREAPREFVLIRMDELSYQELGIPLNQPWPRSTHAELLMRLAEAGAKRVVFDVLFLDAGPDAAVDEQLRLAFGKLPVVLGTDVIMQANATAGGTFFLEQVLTPYKPFTKQAEQLALVKLPEEWGSVRRFLVERTRKTEHLRSLSEASIDMALNAPERPSERDFINFYGPPGSVRYFSYYQVIDPERPVPEELLKDKVIFVGLVLETEFGPAQKDVFQTPYGRMFGSEIHLTAAANLHQKNWISRLSSGLELLFVALATFVLCAALALLKPNWGGLVYGVALLGWAIGSYVSFLSGVFLPGTLLFAAVLPMTLLGSSLYYYLVTRRAQLKMQSAFQYYLSPEMAARVAKDPDSLGLGGEKIWATALFTDIASFTSITESMPAEQVSAMLNAYFTEVMEVIFQNEGTLIKFIGDAVFVIWGAPIKIDDHAAKAVRTALEIDRGVKKFNATERFPALHTRIGVHTGPMVVGNLGSARRFDYTAIGDSVNLASRVEGINKYFGTSVLITESTKKEMGDSNDTLYAGGIQVVGKSQNVGLYMVFAERLPRQVCELWLEAIELFKARSWDDAKAKFVEAASASDALKGPVELYLNQIEMHVSAEPDSKWQGEIVFTSK